VIKLSYTLTLSDYKAALRLHLRQSIGRRFAVAVLRIVIPTVAAAGLIVFLLFKARGTELSASFITVEIGLIFLSIALPIARYFDTRICFKRIFPNAATVPTISTEIDDECIRIQSPGVSEGKFYWKAIVKFDQDDKVTMLYIDKRRFLFFPTEILSQSERAEFKALADLNVVTR
jgi:hypothetical protein